MGRSTVVSEDSKSQMIFRSSEGEYQSLVTHFGEIYIVFGSRYGVASGRSSRTH